MPTVFGFVASCPSERRWHFRTVHWVVFGATSARPEMPMAVNPWCLWRMRSVPCDSASNRKVNGVRIAEPDGHDVAGTFTDLPVNHVESLWPLAWDIELDSCESG
jgi:hypothetical protein